MLDLGPAIVHMGVCGACVACQICRTCTRWAHKSRGCRRCCRSDCPARLATVHKICRKFQTSATLTVHNSCSLGPSPETAGQPAAAASQRARAQAAAVHAELPQAGPGLQPFSPASRRTLTLAGATGQAGIYNFRMLTWVPVGQHQAAGPCSKQQPSLEAALHRLSGLLVGAAGSSLLHTSSTAGLAYALKQWQPSNKSSYPYLYPYPVHRLTWTLSRLSHRAWLPGTVIGSMATMQPCGA